MYTASQPMNRAICMNSEDRPTPILHHYEASPYAEKIRLIFGITGLEWQSLLSPVQPPRPNLDPLTGGYRRIPVLQIGADLYCDTQLIAHVLSELTGNARIAPPATRSSAAALAERAEGEVFFSAIAAVPPLRTLRTVIGAFGIMGALQFVSDRQRMMQGGTVRAPAPKQAKAVLQDFAQQLDTALQKTRFLGGDAPDYTDLCCFHPLWLNAFVCKQGIGKGYPQIERWQAEIAHIGHGKRIEIQQSSAFDQALAHPPADLGLSLEHPLLGQNVNVAPTDYGVEPVAGRLVGVGSDRCTVARETTAFGTLQVHFPLAGYEITARSR